ncbi:MAG: protein kinase domain-containing protein [Planctomycetaceae bacterium]
MTPPPPTPTPAPPAPSNSFPVKQFPQADSSEVARQRDVLAACERFEHDWHQGTAADLESYLSGVAPAHREIVLATLEELLRELQSASLHHDSSVAAPRFEILRPLAAGGMGVVSEALDREFQRTVALKEILPAGADDESYRQRFLTEASLTGRLEHPGIIPVYSRGSQPDGRPFYAMRLITGEHSGTLQQALRQFHDSPPTDLAERDLAWRGLIRRVIDVCHTMAYAHSQGVLHRDLKPANILLGPYGETLVVDWGLAKDLRQTGPVQPLAGQATADEIHPLRQSNQLPGSPGTVTRGLGTLGHAAPEQLSGEVDAAGPKSDIYSLGTILYALLTGTSPFPSAASETPSSVVHKVCAGDFRRPRQIHPHLDHGLEAICLKAMSREPTARYATASALAADLERHLAGEAVSAWREPWSVRARRWVARHRTLVTTAGVALALTALGTSTVAVLQTRNRQALASESEKLAAALRVSRTEQQTAELERARAARAQHQAERERNRAIEGENLAIQAVDEFRQALVGHPELVNLPQFAQLRKDLLQKPLAYYRQLRDRLAVLPEPSLKTLESLRKATTELATLQDEIGDLTESLRLQDSVIQLCTRALEHPELHEEPARLPWRLARVEAHLAIGRALARTSDAERGLAEYRQAVSELDQLPREQPPSPRPDVLRALSLGGIAEALSLQQRIAEARDQYTQALALQQRNVERHPNDPAQRRTLAYFQLNQARLCDLLNQPAEAAELRRSASHILEELGENLTTDPQQRHRTAAGHLNRGIQLAKERQPDQALVEYRAAVAGWRSLMREFPAHNEYAHACRLALTNLANLLNERQQAAEQLAMLQELVALDQSFIQKNPEVLDYRAQLVETAHALGHLLVIREQTAEAATWYAEALRHAEYLMTAVEGEPRWRRQVVELSAHLIDDLAVAGDLDAAHARLAATLPIALSLVESDLVTPVDRRMLHVLLGNFSGIDELLGEPARGHEHRLLALQWDQRDPDYQALDQRLRSVLEGGPPASTAEALLFSRRLAEREDYPAALRLCTAALRNDAGLIQDRQQQAGLLAACLAIRVSASLPEDRSEEAAQLREQARAWLRRELEEWRRLGPEWYHRRQSALRRWRCDGNLAPVLRPADLARLPEPEQQAWRQLFADAAQLAESPPGPEPTHVE